MNNKSFFAAANGYEGFRSRFDKVFSHQRLNKLFVIKGGPGTGKSTLMKMIANLFITNHNITYVYCSSDPNSLDGIIIENNGIKIGIADGTSPHVIEPSYPGAFEEIINLGDGFDYHKLYNLSKQVIELNDTKKYFYKKGYHALNVAGTIHKYILDYLCDHGTYNKTETVAKVLIKDLNITETTMVDHGFLIGAFCKEGYVKLNNPTHKKTIVIHGDGISEYILMSKLKDILLQNKGILHIYPSAFSDDLYDSIETDKYVFTTNNQLSETFDSCELITSSVEYDRLKNMYINLLNEAQKAFNFASDYHFKLEDIYSKSISFEENLGKYEKITEEINYLLINNR